MSASVMSFMCLVPVFGGPHWSLRRRAGTNGFRQEPNRLVNERNLMSRRRAPGVTAALGWRGRC